MLSHLVKFVPFADSIVFLDDGGKIVQHGTYDELRKTERFVKMLGLQDAPGISSTVDSGDASASDKPSANAPTPNTAFELTRKTGDASLYKFYLRSVGKLLFSGWIFCGAAYIFSGRIPRESSSALSRRLVTDNARLRDMASYLDRERHHE